MPPRTQRPAELSPEPKPEPRHAKADGEICDAHWPNGWPEAATTASCIHGTWTR